MSVRKKELCDSCQKRNIEPGNEGVYLGDYLGNKTDRIHVCENCYRSKEKEYLENYAFIYNYCSRRIEEGGNDTGYIKVNDAACYALKKDDAGKVLRQKNCSHCQPWKQKGSKKILAEKLKEILNSPEYIAVPDLPDYNDYYNKLLFNGEAIVLMPTVPLDGTTDKTVFFSKDLEPADWEEIIELIKRRNKEKEQIWEGKKSKYWG